jgi:toxin ParE1/3/4
VSRVVITSTADADTAHVIALLAAKAGKGVAARYNADFDKVYERLAYKPESGSPRYALGRHIRMCVVSPYVIIYEYIESDDTVMIMRIVHGRRNITRRFLRGV